MRKINIDEMLKAQQWERAKGELRAMVAMQGSYSSTSEQELSRWQDLRERVENFIDAVEGEGEHE